MQPIKEKAKEKWSGEGRGARGRGELGKDTINNR